MITADTSGFDHSKIKAKIEERIKATFGLEVGFFETAKYENGTSVATVAQWQEFGTWNIPPRPFFRNAIKEHQKEWVQTLKWQIQEQKDVKKALEIVGVVVRNDISSSITSIQSPANSDITINGGWMRSKGGKSIFIEGKKSSNPLIDTGFMRDSVDYRITE